MMATTASESPSDCQECLRQAMRPVAGGPLQSLGDCSPQALSECPVLAATELGNRLDAGGAVGTTPDWAKLGR